MNTALSRKQILFLLLGLFTVVALIVWMRSADLLRKYSPSKSVSAYQERVRTWEDKFNRTPEDAYTQFLKTADMLAYHEAHTLSHIVGAILYDREGIEGLPQCTSDFGFGCYHGFAGSVIETKGITGVGEFTEACKGQGRVAVCEHGVGHGLLAYFGPDALTEALALCPQDPLDRVGGCYNGVFMEFFLSTLQRDHGVPMRALDSRSPEEPCESGVPEKFQPACYYELPAWWLAWAGETSNEDKFKAIGVRCESVVEANLREVCFKGTGSQIAVYSNYELSRIQAGCSRMPERGRTPCLGEALSSVPVSELSIQTQKTSP